MLKSKDSLLHSPLFEFLSTLSSEPPPLPVVIKHGVYRHSKRNLYELLFIAGYTENVEDLVICHALYGNYAYLAIPLSTFVSEFERLREWC